MATLTQAIIDVREKTDEAVLEIGVKIKALQTADAGFTTTLQSLQGAAQTAAQVDTKIAAAFGDFVGGAPVDLNSWAELLTRINADAAADASGFAGVLTQVATKANSADVYTKIEVNDKFMMVEDAFAGLSQRVNNNQGSIEGIAIVLGNTAGIGPCPSFKDKFLAALA